MPQVIVEIGVVVARRKLKGPWADHAWLPRAVLPSVPAAAAWERLSAEAEEETFYAGKAELSLHSGDTSHYRDNLLSGGPRLWVSLRPTAGDEVELATVTADPYEGEAMAEAMGEIVEAVPMPPAIEAVLAAFVAEHHMERPFVKRERKRADPEALGRRGPGRGER